MAAGGGRQGPSGLAQRPLDRVEGCALPDERGPAVLVLGGPVAPLVEGGRPGRGVLGLVDHRDRQVDQALFGPGPPVLVDPPERLCRGPGGVAGRAGPEGDQGGRDLQGRVVGQGTQIDTSDKRGDLVAAPLAPVGVAWVGWRPSFGEAVMALKSPDAGRVVADAGAGRRRLSTDGQLRVADTVQVQPVQVVAAHQVQQDLGGVGGSVGMAGVDPEVAAEPVAAEADRTAVGQQGAGQPVGPPLVGLPGLGVEPVAVEEVLGAGGRLGGWPVPDGPDDDEGVHLHPGGVGLADQVGQRVKAGSDRDPVGQWLQRLPVPGVTAPSDLGEDRVGPGGRGVGHHGGDVAVAVERRVEGVHPEAPILRDGRIGHAITSEQGAPACPDSWPNARHQRIRRAG
jgi:hypothetical protein